MIPIRCYYNNENILLPKIAVSDESGIIKILNNKVVKDIFSKKALIRSGPLFNVEYETYVFKVCGSNLTAFHL